MRLLLLLIPVSMILGSSCTIQKRSFRNGYYISWHKSGPKEKKKPTIEQTLEYFEIGLTVEEIASKRQLSKGTIYGHLSQLIKNEKLDILQVMDEETYTYLKRIIGTKELQLSEIKELAGENISYEQIRLYQAHLLR